MMVQVPQTITVNGERWNLIQILGYLNSYGPDAYIYENTDRMCPLAHIPGTTTKEKDIRKCIEEVTE